MYRCDLGFYIEQIKRLIATHTFPNRQFCVIVYLLPKPCYRILAPPWEQDHKLEYVE